MTPQLTAGQNATLKTHILANGDTAQLYNDGNLDGLAALLNAPANPAYIIWRTTVTLDEIQQNGFDWTQVDNLAEPKARTWEWLFSNQSRTVNPSKANVRAGIDEVWAGTAGKLAVRAQVYVHCKRAARRVERVFATGTGTDATPGVMATEGPIAFQELIGL